MGVRLGGCEGGGDLLINGSGGSSLPKTQDTL